MCCALVLPVGLLGEGPAAFLLRCLCLGWVALLLVRGLGSLYAYPLCGLCFLKAFHASLEGQNENGHAPISSSRAKYHHPPYSKPSGIDGLYFCGPNSADPCSACPQWSSWGKSEGPALLPFVGPWGWDWWLDYVHTHTLPFPGEGEGLPHTVLYRATTLRAVAQLCMHLFCSSWEMAEGPCVPVCYCIGWRLDTRSRLAPSLWQT